jgi:hypothetical protein
MQGVWGERARRNHCLRGVFTPAPYPTPCSGALAAPSPLLAGRIGIRAAPVRSPRHRARMVEPNDRALTSRTASPPTQKAFAVRGILRACRCVHQHGKVELRNPEAASRQPVAPVPGTLLAIAVLRSCTAAFATRFIHLNNFLNADSAAATRTCRASFSTLSGTAGFISH